MTDYFPYSKAIDGNAKDNRQTADALAFFNSFAFLSVIWAEFSSQKRDLDQQSNKILWISKAVLLIAALQYFVTWISRLRDKVTKTNKSAKYYLFLRYMDWLITVPLLTWIYYLYAEQFVELPFPLLIVYSAGVIVFGLLSNFFNSPISLLVSLILYILTTIEIIRIETKVKDSDADISLLSGFFYIGWIAYPIGYFLPIDTADIIFNIADFVNKGVFALVLVNLVNSNN